MFFDAHTSRHLARFVTRVARTPVATLKSAQQSRHQALSGRMPYLSVYSVSVPFLEGHSTGTPETPPPPDGMQVGSCCCHCKGKIAWSCYRWKQTTHPLPPALRYQTSTSAQQHACILPMRQLLVANCGLNTVGKTCTCTHAMAELRAAARLLLLAKNFLDCATMAVRAAAVALYSLFSGTA